MNKKLTTAILIASVLLPACSGKSFSQIVAEKRVGVEKRIIANQAKMVHPVVPAALQEIRKYKAACGGHYCNVNSKRAREVKNIVWHALGYVPVDAKPGTVFRDLINEWEEFQHAG